ncbi:terpene synthase metal binding domain-containing protein [Ustulina deusta]|nr:terpene synthase metal binding domain-containing protein [Ustulina deusta]
MIETTADAAARRVTISLPDMFKSFLVREPVVNRHYEAVRPESEEWLRSIMSLTPKQHRRVNLCDFSYFCTVLVPYCPRDKLRVVSDWGNWVFLFDDMFDEGELTEDPVGSERIINNLLSIMLPEAPRTSQQPVVTAHDDIFKRLAAPTVTANVARSGGVLGRYIRAMESYCAGALKHIQDHALDKVLSVQEMVDTRRMSIGVFPMYPLIEFAYGLNLPDGVFEHPTVRTLEDLGAEFVMMMIDILSYRKEEAVRALPSWGADVDAQVRQYIQGIQNIVQANLSWSFRSGRYFGSKGDQVLLMRKIDVLMHPSFLARAPQAVKV